MSSTITVSGNLTNEPSLRKLNGEKFVCRFTLATSRKIKGDANQWIDKDKLYLDVECWGSLAQNVRTTLTKGMPAVCVGTLYTDSYQSKEGQPVTKIKMRANTVAVDLNRHVAAVVKLGGEGSISLGDLKLPREVVAPDSDYSVDAAGAPAGTVTGASGDFNRSDPNQDPSNEYGNGLGAGADGEEAFHESGTVEKPLVGATVSGLADSSGLYSSEGDSAYLPDDQPPY